MKRVFLNTAVIIMILAAGVFADDTKKSPLDGIKLSSLAYFDYSNGKTGLAGDEDTSYNQFALKRGYFTLEKKMESWIGMRMTLDLTQDDKGDYKIRQKYLYGTLSPKDAGIFTGMKAELGLGHIPWLDFEEHVNPYRCQGTMFIERAGVLNSADLGVSLQGSFGGKLEEASKKTGNSHYDGRYGSWHVGIYNGSGYHAKENNNNKVGELRLTFRPLADAAPGLQVSYFGVVGKGNLVDTLELPNYYVHLGMLSYEHPMLTLTGQYLMTEGNAKGEWVDSNGDGLKTQGYSAFANVKFPGTNYRFSIFGRYDHFDTDSDSKLAADKTAYNTIIGGVSYDLYSGNLIMLTFETTDYEDNVGGMGKVPSAGKNLGKDQKVQVVYQIKI